MICAGRGGNDLILAAFRYALIAYTLQNNRGKSCQFFG